MEKNSLIINNALEFGEELTTEANGKGRKFVSRFIEAGLAHYEQFGDVLITKETLDKFIQTMVGCPVIIKHKDITDKNADKERVGVVSKVWFDDKDGWFYCEGVIWDKQAIDLVKNQGWSVSCTYDFESDFKKGTYHGKEYNMEFTNGEFLHLALVPNPRYERATIVMNSKDIDKETMFLEGLKELLSTRVFNSAEDIEFAKELGKLFDCEGENSLGECRVLNYNPNQKRVPKGNPNGGQFAKQDGTSNIKPKLRDYNNFLQIHKAKGLIEKYPKDFLGTTDEEIADFLGIKENKPAIFITPIETVKIYKNNIPHIRHEKDKTRLLGLERAIKTLQNPNVIIQDKKENYYIKFFDKQGKNKAHLQVIKTTKKGGFYKTNFPMSKNKFEKLEGQVIYDLSSKR